MVESILYSKEARQKVKTGIDSVCNAVKVTLGAMGRLVLIKRAYLSTQDARVKNFPIMSTKDGVSVVRAISLPDKVENMGADLVKEAAEKTMQQAGDATTTTCVLLQELVEKGLEMVDGGVNPMDLKQGIEAAVEDVVAQLKENSTPIVNKDGTLDIEKLRQVATVSANNDSNIGKLIAEAFQIIGKDGIINMEEAKGITTEVKTSDGVKFKRGWVSPYFINNHAKNECVLHNPYILLYDKKIAQAKPLEPIIQMTMQQNRPLLIVCDDADGEALAWLAMNTAQGKISVCVVRSPEFGDLKRQSMEDLAIVTGGTYISDEKGTGLKSVKLSDLGTATKVVVNKDYTSIINGGKDQEKFNDLINNLKMDLVNQEGVEKEKTEERIAKLQGSVAVIYVGGATEVEMREKWDRIDDAVRATQAAKEEGFIAGGGTAFLRVKMPKVKNPALLKGYELVFNSIEKPLVQICENAGVNSTGILEQVKQLKGDNGYNAKTNKTENLVKSGIIDPVKALRCALQNAASAACILLTTEAAFYDFAS